MADVSTTLVAEQQVACEPLDRLDQYAMVVMREVVAGMYADRCLSAENHFFIASSAYGVAKAMVAERAKLDALWAAAGAQARKDQEEAARVAEEKRALEEKEASTAKRQEYLRRLLHQTDLGPAACIALGSRGMVTVEDVLRKSFAELRAIPGIGPKTLDKIRILHNICQMVFH